MSVKMKYGTGFKWGNGWKYGYGTGEPWIPSVGASRFTVESLSDPAVSTTPGTSTTPAFTPETSSTPSYTPDSP